MAIGRTAWMAAVVSLATVSTAPGDDWPQWLGPKRDSVWRETGIVERFPENGPPVVRRQTIGGGYAGPSVAGDRVLVTDSAESGA